MQVYPHIQRTDNHTHILTNSNAFIREISGVFLTERNKMALLVCESLAGILGRIETNLKE